MQQKLLFIGQPNSLDSAKCYAFASWFSTQLEKELICLEIQLSSEMDALLSTEDIILVFCPVLITDRCRPQIRNFLTILRDVRMPYLFIREDGVLPESIKRLIVPVGNLVEEKEKASWGSSLGKFLNAENILLQPKDRGTRSTRNLNFIKGILEKKEIPVQVINGKRNSMKIEYEALVLANSFSDLQSLLVISSSREYGLDDMFFGPKELHIILKSTLAVLVINPRDDIYVLCGD